MAASNPPSASVMGPPSVAGNNRTTAGGTAPTGPASAVLPQAQALGVKRTAKQAFEGVLIPFISCLPSWRHAPCILSV